MSLRHRKRGFPKGQRPFGGGLRGQSPLSFLTEYVNDAKRGMMGKSAAVFCHNGLGDGVVSLVLSNNLHLNGWKVDTYHNSMGGLQGWFPHLLILPYPKLEKLEEILSLYDQFFVVQNDSNEFTKKLISEGKRRFADKVKVIYLYPSKRIVHEIYYQDSCIDPTRSIAENLRLMCEHVLRLPKNTKSNGVTPPQHLRHRRFRERVVIHPTSSRQGKNWPKEKFLDLAYLLRYEEFDPVFAIGSDAKSQWQDLTHYGFEAPEFLNLEALASFIYESGYLVGNDSGLVHLASCLGVPTLMIARRKTYARLSRPSFAPCVVVTPSPLIPNISGFRLRDRYWKNFISTKKVLCAFDQIVAKTL